MFTPAVHCPATHHPATHHVGMPTGLIMHYHLPHLGDLSRTIRSFKDPFGSIPHRLVFCRHRGVVAFRLLPGAHAKSLWGRSGPRLLGIRCSGGVQPASLPG